LRSPRRKPCARGPCDGESDRVYQSASRRPTPLPTDPVQVVLVFDIPAGSLDLASRTAFLADEYARLIATSVPGVRAREAAIARGAAASGDHRRRPIAGLLIDGLGRDVRIDGQRVRLTYREFELLSYLAASPRRPVSRTELIREVWRNQAPADSPRTVDTHVRRVRVKLGRYAGVLTTVRGRGYRFDPGPDVRVTAGRRPA
jgi:two-component system OmpR family response regulator